ncbi:MAG TPA: hypothetical protein PKE69_20905 [Pyrinomonadaceae bacterium]|nr:hypothetical protein [Pyrinomonadaceae bacterium]
MKKLLATFLLIFVLGISVVNTYAQSGGLGCSYNYTVWEWYPIFPPGTLAPEAIGVWIPHTMEIWYDCSLPQPEMPPIN